MTYIKIIFLLILAMLERCHLIQKQVVPLENPSTEIKEVRSSSNLTGSWIVVPVEHHGQKKSNQKNPLLKNAIDNEILSTGGILSLFPDSTFTEITENGTYVEGIYFLSADTVISFRINNQVQKVRLSFGETANKHVVMNLKNISTSEERSFVEYAYQLENYKEDPFYKKNNEWRLKPLKPQSSVEVKRKLDNYIQHNCFILKAATERNQAVVTWEFSKGIIKIYNGGIGAVPERDIPKSWINAFYSQSDATKAYDLFDLYLTSNKYKGASTGNWVKDDYNILTSVYAAAHTVEANDSLAR